MADMDHDRLQEQLWALLDGELPQEERPTLLAHLEGCRDCRERQARWERLSGTFFRLPEGQPSERFLRRVMARVENQPTGGWAAWNPIPARWLIPALGAGLAAGLLVFNLPVNLPVKGPEPSTEELLLASNAGSRQAQWVFLADSPQNDDDLIGLALEGER